MSANVNPNSKYTVTADTGVVRDAADTMKNVGMVLSTISDSLNSSKSSLLESVNFKGMESLESGLSKLITSTDNLNTSATNISNQLNTCADTIDETEKEVTSRMPTTT